MSDWNSAPEPFEPPTETFRADLARKDQKRRARLALTFGLAGFMIAALLGATVAGFYYAWIKPTPQIPPLASLMAMGREPGIRFLDRNGALIADRGPRFGEQVTASQLPPHVVQAFLAAEDRRFLTRTSALDLRAIGRALVVNARAGETQQGASTLAHQLAKTLFLTPDQTFKRKVQEAVLAQRMYDRLGRAGILDLYLNRTFLGARTHGVDAASRTYFGHPARELTLAEAALLAGLPKATTRLTPTRNLEGALERSRLVLSLMRREGWITQAQEQAAIANPPKLTTEVVRSQGEGVFGWALDMAAAQSAQLAAGRGDLTITLSLDPALQRTTAAALTSALARSGPASDATQGAVVILGAGGDILAMAGGRDYRSSPFNRAVQARRQPGSAFKPFVFAAALEDGARPGDTRQDAPLRIGGWSPQNYGGGYSGGVSIDTAFVRSINTVAVRLARETGGARVADLARRFGIEGLPAEPNLSIALGAYETSLLEMTGAYQVFQSGGLLTRPRLILKIEDRAGNLIYAPSEQEPPRVYAQENAAQMLRMMRGVVERGTGRRAAIGRPAGGKTGTSQNWRDAWFVGFTPDLAAGVWFGNDNNRPMRRVSGGDLPAQLWRTVMLSAHRDLPARGFDWVEEVAPEMAPEAERLENEGEAAPPVPPADTRRDFYDGLAAEFAAEAGGF